MEYAMHTLQRDMKRLLQIFPHITTENVYVVPIVRRPSPTVGARSAVTGRRPLRVGVVAALLVQSTTFR
jgi:hypothetical protein